MGHQVFLSYATEDSDSARLLCRVLEAEEGIRCWIAPRDVPAGTDYAAAILEAIKSAGLVVLLFSSFSNTSPYVLREVERAVAYERPVLSVRLDNTTASTSLEYYLNLWQWLDAPRGIESRRGEIVSAVRKHLEPNGDPAASDVATQAAPAPTSSTVAPSSTHLGPPEGERRRVTVLSVGIADFGNLSGELDPEALRDLVSATTERLALAVDRYGGLVHRSAGDDFVAIFGTPRAHEDDPERALHAALEMRRGIASFNKGRSVPVGLHFGVNTGLVLVGGPKDRADTGLSIVGDAVSLASRLRDLAKPGEILVGPDAHRQTEDVFSWQAEVVEAKGKPRALTAYRLLELKAGQPAGDSRRTRGLTSPLVGRANEVASLTRCIVRLHEGTGGIVLVTAEAGMGKSRLVAEARATAEREGISWLEGHTLSFGRTISYWPLLEIIQQDAGIESDDPESERWAKLAVRLGMLFGEERNEILPYLGTLLSLSLPEELAQRARYLDGEAMGRQIYRATRRYFARVARARPTVVVFEDLHWLDGSTASLLEHLLPLTSDVPILFCLVSRPERETAYIRLREIVYAEYAGRLTEIALKPLSDDESAVLIRNLVLIDELPPRLKAAISEKAEGNPFFLEEVVRNLIDLGGLARDDASGRWRVTDRAAGITIPDTLQGLVMARVDRLDDDLKQVLRLASVVGRSFFYRVLASVTEAERELDQSLAALEARELILEKSRDPELEYLFKHALVQEATYESILLARRKQLHLRVARAIETLFSARLDGFYPVLAYHFSRAEDWEKAQDYLFKAGDQAGSISADAEALAHYREAVEAYSRAFGDRWDPVDRAVLERKMGEALHRRGDHAQARDYLYQALATLGHAFPDSRRAIRREMMRQVVLQVWHRAWPRFGTARTTPEALRRADETCRVYQSIGWIEGFADQARALLLMLTDLNLAEKQGVSWAASAGASAMGMMFMVMPAPRLSESYVARARRIAEQGGWPAERAQADLIDGMREFWLLGDFSRAEEFLRRSWERFRELGDIRSSAGIAMGVGVHIPAERGEFDQALAMARELGQNGRDAGDCLTEAYGEAWESELLYMMGDLEAGEAGMRRTIATMLAATDYRIASKVAGRLAACLLVQGRVQEAQLLLAEHRAYTQKYRIRGFNGTMVITGTAAAALSTAEQTHGPSREALLKEAKRTCAAALKQGRLDVTAYVPAYRLQGTYEWLSGHPGKAGRWWRRSLDHADKLGARYEGALTALEMGRRLGDRGGLERAASEFEAMGCRLFLAQARESMDGTR